jgi:hypothetical protein
MYVDIFYEKKYFEIKNILFKMKIKKMKKFVKNIEKTVVLAKLVC